MKNRSREREREWILFKCKAILISAHMYKVRGKIVSGLAGT